MYRNGESPLTTARESHRAARDAAQHAPPLHGTLRKLGKKILDRCNLLLNSTDSGKFFVHSSFHLTKYLLSTYYVQSTILGTRDTVGRNTAECPCGCAADMLEEADRP